VSRVSQPSLVQSVVQAILTTATGAALWLIRHVSWTTRKALAEAAGRRIARSQRKRHQAAEVNLTLAFGDRYDSAERNRIGEESFSSFIRCMLDSAAMIPTINQDNWQQMVHIPQADIDALGGHFAKGKGVLVMFSHYGNWELMGAAMPFICGDRQVHVVAKRQSAWSNPLIEKFRTTTGNKVIYKEGAVRATLRALKNNQLVGLSIDQNFSGGIFVPFFGTKAGTVDTLGALSRASGAPIVPLVCVPKNDGSYEGRLLPAIEPMKTADKVADVYQITLSCIAVLEEIIRQKPEMWLWGHKRWKSRPLDEDPKLNFYDE
jgi:KDO2-lipid IV(A) lauroyltransferase